MSGHNKWSKIKHKKAATDAKKSAVFSKFTQLISFESKKVGGDTSSPGLKLAIERAKKSNMPNSNIERAISKGLNKQEDTEEFVYEAYGPDGVAIILSVITDNKNRTIGQIKNVLSKQGATFAEKGAASWAFEKNDGIWETKIKIPISENTKKNLKNLEEKLMEIDDIQNIYNNAE